MNFNERILSATIEAVHSSIYELSSQTFYISAYNGKLSVGFKLARRQKRKINLLIL